jgi:HEPN domain-containing protein
MTSLEKSKQILSQAKNEFLKADEFKDEFSYFLALANYQQAAVNALKAYLYSKAELSIILYIHSVFELIDEGKQFDPEIESISAAVKLDRLSRIVTTRMSN